MKLLFFLLPFVVLLNAAEPQSLFDGRATDGWVEVTGKPISPTSWTIDDGCLRTVITRGAGAQDIRTTTVYHNFDFEFDWKVLANGNSGVKYLIQRIDEWTNQLGRQARARGLEYQIADNNGPDAVEAIRSAASLYSAIPPQPPTNPAIGQFHHGRIVVKDDHVEHWLDGVRVVSFDLNQPEVKKVIADNRKKEEQSKAPLRDTAISLQNHGTLCWFKNLKIRRLE
jgi:hypothetical protein